MDIILKTCSPELQKKLRGYVIARSILNSWCQEAPERDVLKFLLRPGDVVADIGANVGEYTWLLATIVGRGGIVYERLHLNAPPGRAGMKNACCLRQH